MRTTFRNDLLPLEEKKYRTKTPARAIRANVLLPVNWSAKSVSYVSHS